MTLGPSTLLSYSVDHSYAMVNNVNILINLAEVSKNSLNKPISKEQ